MASNGNDQNMLDPRQLMGQIPRKAPAQARPPDPAPDPAATTDDITSQIADTARMMREVGRYAREHGEYLHKMAEAFADRLQDSGRSFVLEMLDAERRKLAELEKIMGRPPRGGEDGRGT